MARSQASPSRPFASASSSASIGVKPEAKQEPLRAGAPMSTPTMAAAKNPAAPPAKPSIPPDMAAQMQKLIEQKNRLPTQQGQPSGAQAPAPAPQEKPAVRYIWQGALSWHGFDSETHAQMNVHTRVIVSCPAEQPNDLL